MKTTIENIAKAFILESQARNRYSFYAGAARAEGYLQVAAQFERISDQEKEHANSLMWVINNLKRQMQEQTGGTFDEVDVEAFMPTTMEETLRNLRGAVELENRLSTDIYPGFADTAAAEGLPEVAGQLRALAKAEEFHEELYADLLGQIESGTIFKKPEAEWWVCRACGYTHYGNEPPGRCPFCGRSYKYYELKTQLLACSR